MKLKAKDLVIGNEYWFNVLKTESGVFLGRIKKTTFFTAENKGCYTSFYLDEFGCKVVGFHGPKKELRFILKKDNQSCAQKYIEGAEKLIDEAKKVIERIEKGNDLSVYVGGMIYQDYLWNRRSGEYANKAFYLSDFYNWDIKVDSLGCNVLIPTKK